MILLTWSCTPKSLFEGFSSGVFCIHCIEVILMLRPLLRGLGLGKVRRMTSQFPSLSNLCEQLSTVFAQWNSSINFLLYVIQLMHTASLCTCSAGCVGSALKKVEEWQKNFLRKCCCVYEFVACFAFFPWKSGAATLCCTVCEDDLIWNDDVGIPQSTLYRVPHCLNFHCIA